MNKKKKEAAASKANKIPATNPLLDRFENHILWQVALLVLIPFFVYIKTTSFEFINMDDMTIIVSNLDKLTNFHNIGRSFNTDAFMAPHGDFYRPLQTVSFFVDAFIGADKPYIYHLSNLIYHIATVLSLFFLLRSLHIKNLTAFFAALIFSIHPLLSSAVSWVPARGDLLLALFSVLSLTTFINYCRVKQTSWKIAWYLLHTLVFLLVIFSKEVSVVLPVLLLSWYFFLREEKNNYKELVPVIVIWIFSGVLFFIVRSKVVIGTPPDFILGIKPLMNDLPAIPIVVAKFLIPANLSTLPLFEPIFTFAGLIILLFIIIVVIKNSRAKKWMPAFGFLWFLLFITPPLFFKIYYSHFLVEYYEHRAYLPVMGLLIILAFILNGKIFRSNKALFNFLPVVVIALFAFLSSLHSDDFKNSMVFFGRAIELGNPGAAVKRGEMYMGQRDFSNAQTDFENAVNLSDSLYPPALYAMGKVNATVTKDHKAAEYDFSKTIYLDTTYIDAYIDRANERISTKKVVGAFDDINKAKQLDSFDYRIYATLGSIYVNTNDFKNAVDGFSKAISLNNYDAESYNNRAYAFYRLQDYDSALNDCNRAISIFPEFMNAYYNKGIIYLQLNKPAIAVKTFDTTLALADNFYFGYFYRGMAKKQLNDMKGACDDWQKSVNLGFTMAQDTINKYCK